MLQTLFYLSLKIGLLILALPFLLDDLVLVQSSLLNLNFVTEPFVHSAIFVIAIGAIITLATKSMTYILWVVSCLLFSALFFVHHFFSLYFGQYSICTLVMIVLFVVGTINFLFPNKLTEPLLVFLPINAGAWIFWSTLYSPYYLFWFSHMRNHMSVESSFYEVLRNWPTYLETLAIGMIPMMVIYVLGSRSYTHSSLYWKLVSGKKESD